MKKQNEDEGWEGFLNLCSRLDNRDDFRSLFSLFFTFEEREMMAARYLIVRAILEAKLTQREISEKYQVSIAQITRGSNALKMISPELKQFLLSKD